MKANSLGWKSECCYHGYSIVSNLTDKPLVGPQWLMWGEMVLYWLSRRGLVLSPKCRVPDRGNYMYHLLTKKHTQSSISVCYCGNQGILFFINSLLQLMIFRLLTAVRNSQGILWQPWSCLLSYKYKIELKKHIKKQTHKKNMSRFHKEPYHHDHCKSMLNYGSYDSLVLCSLWGPGC